MFDLPTLPELRRDYTWDTFEEGVIPVLSCVYTLLRRVNPLVYKVVGESCGYNVGLKCGLKLGLGLHTSLGIDVAHT